MVNRRDGISLKGKGSLLHGQKGFYYVSRSSLHQTTMGKVGSGRPHCWRHTVRDFAPETAGGSAKTITETSRHLESEKVLTSFVAPDDSTPTRAPQNIGPASNATSSHLELSRHHDRGDYNASRATFMIASRLPLSALCSKNSRTVTKYSPTF
jgi:hypothetical protein